MNLTLTRYGSIPGKGTFGELEIEGMTLYSVEREWLDNRSNISCIPDGDYKLVPHNSRRHGETWALEGDGVTHWEAPDKRWGILFHVANKQSELAGCIGLGRNIGDSWNVISSRHAMEYFLAILARESEHTLTIRWQNGTAT